MNSKRVVAFVVVILVLAIFSILYPNTTGKAVSQEYAKEKAILLRVVDGDTIEVTGPILGNNTHIRLLGINTPEKKMPFANESAQFLKQFENQTIELLRDLEDTDKYQRKLRYLFFDGRPLNIEILERGLASSYMTSGLKYENALLRAENYSREHGIGLWEKSTERCAGCISLIDLNATAEFFIIKNSCDFDCALAGWFVKDAGRNTFWLKPLASMQQQSFNSSSVWNNDADSFFMFDGSGKLVIFFQYSS